MGSEDPMMLYSALIVVALAIGFLFGWFGHAASLEESTDYRYVSRNCPLADRHANRTDICDLCGYDPNLPEGERETI